MAGLDQGDIVHVAAACDEKYAMPLAVMLASIGASLGAGRQVVAHVLESGVEPATRDRVARSIRPDKVALRWVSVPADRLSWCRGTLRSFDTVSIASYYRLLLPEAIADELDRIIYLDCDLVVQHDLWDLWSAQIGDTCLGAVPELLQDARYASSRLGLRLHRELGLRPDLELFNSGVMLINLVKWRTEQVASRAMAYLREAGLYLRWHDQEALNAVIAGDWTPLDAHWNVTMHVFRGRPAAPLAELARAPRILHYNAAIKPWDSGFRHGCREPFYRHLDDTAWSGWRPARAGAALPRKWVARLLRTSRKTGHALGRRARIAGVRLRGWRAMRRQPRRVGGSAVPSSPAREIRVFVWATTGVDDAVGTIEGYLKLGADRVLLSVPTSGGPPARVSPPLQDRLHVFQRASGTGSRHEALRQLLHRHGTGHLCVVVDDDEQLYFTLPGGSTLPDLRDYLDTGCYEAVEFQLAEGGSPSATDEARRRMPVTMRDPLRGRVFVAAAVVGASDRRVVELKCRSRVAVLLYRDGMLIDRDFRAVHGARLADVTGILTRPPRGVRPWAHSLATVSSGPRP